MVSSHFLCVYTHSSLFQLRTLRNVLINIAHRWKHTLCTLPLPLLPTTLSELLSQVCPNEPNLRQQDSLTQSGGFPLLQIPMYDRLGFHWGTSVLAFMTVVMMPWPWLFFKYGKLLRGKSRFATSRWNVDIAEGTFFFWLWSVFVPNTWPNAWLHHLTPTQKFLIWGQETLLSKVVIHKTISIVFLSLIMKVKEGRNGVFGIVDSGVRSLRWLSHTWVTLRPWNSGLKDAIKKKTNNLVIRLSWLNFLKPNSD